MWQLVEILNVLNTLTLKQVFWKTKTFIKKLEKGFLVECTKIEYVSFPYKTALSEANVKTNRVLSTKWTYHKERSFASNYFILLKILFRFKNIIKSWFDVPTTQIPIFVIFVSVEVLFDGAFYLWVTLKLFIRQSSESRL